MANYRINMKTELKHSNTGDHKYIDKIPTSYGYRYIYNLGGQIKKSSKNLTKNKTEQGFDDYTARAEDIYTNFSKFDKLPSNIGDQKKDEIKKSLIKEGFTSKNLLEVTQRRDGYFYATVEKNGYSLTIPLQTVKP